MHENEDIYIPSNSLVTVTDMGHIVEIQHMEKQNRQPRIRKLDADRYVHLATGEIIDFDKKLDRSENLNSMSKTMKKLRYLINNNFKGNPNELFITFTFREDSYDYKFVYEEFKNFMKRFRYSYKEVSTIDYINVVEPHADGQFHSHMLVKFNDLENVFIPSKDLEDLWGNGFIKIKSLKEVDNIGAYLSAYLSDLEVPLESEGDNVVEKQVDGQTKKFIKGGRLKYYPVGMNLYRKSRGIVYPDRIDMKYKKIKEIVGSAKPHYSSTKEIEINDFKMSISYEQYNLKR